MTARDRPPIAARHRLPPGGAEGPDRRLWTIGYEGRTQDDLVRTLQEGGIVTLVDVRELPLSRKRGLSKGVLRARLEAEGMRYEHLRELGAPREARHKWRDGGAFEEFRAAYLSHLEGQRAALDRLEAIASEAPAAILCFEADHHSCHRHFVGAELGRRGWTIVHL